VREEHAHTRCPQCGVIEACCEGICAQPASLLQPYSQCPWRADDTVGDA